MNLQQAGKSFRDFELGALDAEADRHLATYFVTTPYVKSALSLRRTLFLGRNGSGKSALFTQLPRLFNESSGGKVKILQVTPDSCSWDALRRYSEVGLLAEQAHANAWKFTIAIEMASAFARTLEADLVTPEAKTALVIVQKFLTDNFGNSTPTFLSNATKILSGIKSFNISAFGFGAGLSLNDSKTAITPQIIEALIESVSKIAKEVGVIVAFDKLDDSWDGSDDSKKVLIGLLKASKEINDKFKGVSPNLGIAVLIFLRADIYEGLQFDDKDKYRTNEEHIIWSSDLLGEMVKQRLPDSVTVAELFEPGDMRGSISPFNYIVKRTFLRPREILQFLHECIRRSGDDAYLITKDQVREAEERYSSWKVEDLKQEYRRLYPDFEKIVEALRQTENRYDALSDLEAMLEGKIPEVVSEYSVRRIVEILFNSSVIGVRLGNAGSAKFRSEDSDLVLPTQGAVYVHQCLYKGLSIREKRARDPGVAGGSDSAEDVEPDEG